MPCCSSRAKYSATSPRGHRRAAFAADRRRHALLQLVLGEPVARQHAARLVHHVDPARAHVLARARRSRFARARRCTPIFAKRPSLIATSARIHGLPCAVEHAAVADDDVVRGVGLSPAERIQVVDENRTERPERRTAKSRRPKHRHGKRTSAFSRGISPSNGLRRLDAAAHVERLAVPDDLERIDAGRARLRCLAARYRRRCGSAGVVPSSCRCCQPVRSPGRA